MQHAGWKTSEKAISVELLHELQDFAVKSLFNTLFMMFNSRYKGFTVNRVLPTTTRQRIGRMYYILNAGGPINDFAVIRWIGSPTAERNQEKCNRRWTKRKLVVG
jgi:hypothetical protein